MKVISQIKQEIKDFTDSKVPLSLNVYFNQYDVIKRIMMFSNQTYSNGSTDSMGKTKYWFDVVKPRIDSEVKNIDFDIKNVFIYSDKEVDSFSVFLLNNQLQQYLENEEQSCEINDAIEEGAGWGNVVWKKTKDSFERVDLTNFYLTNITAKTLKDTACIERHVLTQRQIREKAEVWNENVDKVLEECKMKEYAKMKEASLSANESKTPFYEVYERNGEISLASLKEAIGKIPTQKDENVYTMAKIIIAMKEGNTDGSGYILYAEEIDEMPYKEYHRGRYNGRWFREGIYELLFDIQTRSNEIGNQIARGLEWASQIVFASDDLLTAQNVLTDMRRGDIVKAKNLRQVEVRLQGLDQLIAEWNRLTTIADKLTNSFEIIQGESLPSGTPFAMGKLLNQNANKLYVFIREKFAISLKEVYSDWVLPKLTKKLNSKDILNITGDKKYLDRYKKMLVDGWYFSNLLSFPPHDNAMAEVIKEQKMASMSEKKLFELNVGKEYFKGLKTRLKVVIDGENTNRDAELQTYVQFANLEQNPDRRTAIIEKAMTRAGMDISDLPKTQVIPQAPTQQPQEQMQNNSLQGLPVSA